MKTPQLLTLVLALSGVAGCNVSSAPSDPNAPPAGCQRTLCGLKRDYCQNPTTPDYCTQCYDECSAIVDTAPGCLNTCQSICQDQNNQPPPPDPCGDALTSCQKSSDNTICVDDLGSQAPDGTPCNDTASRVACKCSAENDPACQNAIYTDNPACKQCDDGWMTACQNGACPNERAAANACFTQNSCTNADCVQCTTETKAWTDCLNAAQEDPSDPAGCNSGSHRCWTQPYCKPDGTSSP